MDIASLHAFITVADTGSFSLASTKLYLTQPAISKRIALLESELDTRLFDRIGRQISLTEAGQALLPRARRILQEIEDSRRALQNLSGKTAGLLRIGTSHHIGLHRLPPVLRNYSKHFPDVELDIQFMDSEQACRAVERGDLETGIVTLPLKHNPSLRAQIIWPDPLSIVIGKTHPLIHQPKIGFPQLVEHKAILPAHGTFTREVIEQTFNKHQLQVKIGLVTNYLETIKMMVSVGLGWSVLPNSMLSKDIKAVQLRGLHMQRDLGIVWHGGRTLSNAALQMQALLRNEIHRG
ncbi:MAG: LysR family transcriptional regulator [Gammaproteobacteria bacterium]|nr:LysR family transcriptional regulator [Gammaproteobacteria bacterium]